MSDRYFVLDAEHQAVPADHYEWGRFTDDPANVRVAETTVGTDWVSTVFLGVNHRLIGDGPPILFETMVFDHSETPSLDEHYMERYTTWEQAAAGHERVVSALREGRQL